MKRLLFVCKPLVQSVVSAPSTKVPVWVIPTNEELMIARHTRSVIGTEAL